MKITDLFEASLGVQNTWNQEGKTFALDTDIRMSDGSVAFIEVYIYRKESGKKKQIGHAYVRPSDTFSEESEVAYIKKLLSRLKQFRIPADLIDADEIDKAVDKFVKNNVLK